MEHFDDDVDDTGVTVSSPGHGDQLNPCVAFCLGIICLVVASCLLFTNEGQYVQSMKAAENAWGALVSLCDEDCSRCDFDAVLHVASGERRPLRSGDTIYASCGFYNFVPVSEVNSRAIGNPIPVELMPGLTPAPGGASRAAVWAWDMAMYQKYYAEKIVQSPDLRTKFEGKYAGDPATVCIAPEFRRALVESGDCEATIPRGQWTATLFDRTKCWVNGEPLGESQCTAAADDCLWEKAECPMYECVQGNPACKYSDEMAFGDATTVCTGCCPATVKTCLPIGVTPLNARRLASYAAGSPSDVPEEAAGEVSAPPILADIKPAGPIYQDCKIRMCRSWAGWSSTLKPSANRLPRLPIGGSLRFRSYLQPASNLHSLEDGRTTTSEIAFGAPLSNGGAATQRPGDVQNSLSLGELEERAGIFSAFASAQLVGLKPEQKFMLHSTAKVTRYVLPGANRGALGIVNVEEYARSNAAAAWDVNSSRVGGPCPAGCICGQIEEKKSTPGDLKICLRRSTTTSMSILAGVSKAAPTSDSSAPGPPWVLRESEVLKAMRGSLTNGQGYRVALNRKVTAEELLNMGEQDASLLRAVLCLAMTLVMWLGFYACLSPLVWVVPKVHACLLGSGPRCIELPMTLVAGAASCCAAVLCSFLVIAAAWLFHRPSVGIPMLLVPLGLLGALCYLAHGRKHKRVVSARQKAFSSLTGVEMVTSLRTSRPQAQVAADGWKPTLLEPPYPVSTTAS